MHRPQLHADLTGSPFDLIVIGGGATGSGIALDAASRGLRVALLERQDFAEGTSSRSTKLVHGGVRYLEAAVKQLDRGQFRLVRDGLRERWRILHNAPHLARRLTLVTPLYRWRDLPYVYTGLCLYDLLAGRRGLGRSRLLGRREALRRFPQLRSDGLKGAVLYYDGQFNDVRLDLTLLLTAQEQGAVTANHVEVTGLLREGGRIVGVQARDRLDGSKLTLRGHGVINATGPFTDRLRQLDDPAAPPLLHVSAGVHLVLDRRFVPPEAGLLIPRTEDGRVLFILPWEGHALVGTTDSPAVVDDHPRPTEADIDYLLRHLRRTFKLEVDRGDIKAAWAGLRPLVADPSRADTSRLTRDHLLQLSPAGLLTVTGGKWTTYRQMAQDAVDRAVLVFGLKPAGPCRTARLPLVGAAGAVADAAGFARRHDLDPATAEHLWRAYGDRAEQVAALIEQGYGAPLAAGHPYLEAEVIHAARYEMACRAIDVLARRLSLATLDRQAALAALPRTVELLAAELGWDEARQQQETALARERLEQGL